MGTEDAVAIGRRVRRIRHWRGKSLDVITGLAGISKSYLSGLETGKRVLDSLKLIVAIANASRSPRRSCPDCPSRHPPMGRQTQP